MSFKIKIISYNLHFKRPAGTSRGVYHDHKIWYVILSSTTNPDHWGIGECAPLFDLSCDYNENYELNLIRFCAELEDKQTLDKDALRPYPSILFGLETALQHYQQQNFQLWSSQFSEGNAGIPINGLIWMGDFKYMQEQIEKKLEQGFRCIKLKIGAINFDDEMTLLKRIRKEYSSEKITLRVDANGAFSPSDALDKLQALALLDIHSIEQPIKAGQYKEMAQLTAKTPLPIALDEELIGVNDPKKKYELLKTINPQYIILKPTLHGGIIGATEWIDLAESMNIGWWVTSALESNIGLNAISQWCATLNTRQLPQGLGTGSLYTNNISMPLVIKEDCLYFNPNGQYFSLNELM